MVSFDLGKKGMNMTQLQLPERIKHYLDKLDDVQRDRVIEAESFKIGGGYRKGHPGNPGGGVVTRTKVQRQRMGLDFTPGEVLVRREYTFIEPSTPASPTTGCLIDHATAGTSTAEYGTVGSEFDSFYREHGPDAIRAIKMYAARLNKIELPVHVEQEQWENVPAEV